MADLYAYAYHITPALEAADAAALHQWLAEHTRGAVAAGRAWSGRILATPESTRILIVSDTSCADDPLNLRLEAELLRLQTNFSMTAPRAMNVPQRHAG